MERIEKIDMEKNNKYWNPIIETLPRERLMEIELKRFRETLRWAKESSPFYRQKLHGIEPEDIRTLEDVAKVPNILFLLEHPRVGLQPLSQPFRDIYFLESICLDADRDIGPFHDHSPFVASSVSFIPPGNRGLANVDHPHFYVDSIAVSEPPAKVALHMDARKGQVFFV
jgi:hypothetical protein